MTFEPVKIPTSPSGWFDYRYYVLSDGALAILRADRDINAEYRAWLEKAQTGTFRQSMPDLWTGSARLSTLTEGHESAPLSVPLVRYPQLDRFPDGRWLLASSRAKLGEHNASVLEADGRVSATLPLGDAIEHLRCAPDGSIWVGYFDEGIFGHDLGAGGIAHFNARGERLWSFNDGKHVGDPLVWDCYALTLDGDALWSCFYNDFPIVRVADGRETVWTNNTSHNWTHHWTWEKFRMGCRVITHGLCLKGLFGRISRSGTPKIIGISDSPPCPDESGWRAGGCIPAPERH